MKEPLEKNEKMMRNLTPFSQAHIYLKKITGTEIFLEKY
jgi:hypothetical protein